MQQSEVFDIHSEIKKLKELSLKINFILEGDDEENVTDSISALYSERKLTVDRIKNWQNSEKGAKLISNSADTYNKGIEEAQRIEEKNIALIDTRYKNIGEKLKKLVKQKSILIYTKEKKDDNRISK